MLKSLLVIVLVCFSAFTAAMAGDGKILTNGSEYKIYNEPIPFIDTPYTIQGGLELTKKEIKNLLANKKDVYDSETSEIIHSTFNKWYTHETITREYQGYGFGKDNRIERKSVTKIVEVFNPAFYFVLISLLLLLISTEFKSKYLRLAAGNGETHLSENKLEIAKTEAAVFRDGSILMACIVTIVAIVFNGIATQTLFPGAVMTCCVIGYLIWSDLAEKLFITDLIGFYVMVIVGIVILF